MTIQFGDIRIQKEQLVSFDGADLLPAATRSAFDFLLDWERGAESFTFHTSGSTGAPKEISFRRSQLLASAQLTIDALQLKAGETALVCLDSRFVAGALMLVRGLTANMNLVVLEPAGNPFRDYSGPCDFVALVPYQLLQILNEVPEKINKVRNIIIGGAPIEPALQDRLKALSGNVYATYGMTETITHVALQKLNGSAAPDYFEGLPGIHFEVDERNCLKIHAPHLTETVVTNDIVYLLDSRRFRWLGRYDNVINTGGVKVQKEELETILSGILSELGVRNRYFVDSVEDASLGRKVILVIEGNSLAPELEEGIRLKVASKKGRYHVPKSILYSQSFFETPTQKIDRRRTLAVMGINNRN
ncbi:MAG: AMP-binding protein [Bacteroidetes bacterium]|nr:AMP-binding protein [Bacteroidota bacterium]